MMNKERAIKKSKKQIETYDIFIRELKELKDKLLSKSDTKWTRRLAKIIEKYNAPGVDVSVRINRGSKPDITIMSFDDVFIDGDKTFYIDEKLCSVNYDFFTTYKDRIIDEKLVNCYFNNLINGYEEKKKRLRYAIDNLDELYSDYKKFKIEYDNFCKKYGYSIRKDLELTGREIINEIGY